MQEHYARALWKMIEVGKKPAESVRALYDVLKTRGRETLMPKIAHAFARLAERDRQRNGLTLSIAHEGDEHKAKSEIKKILSEMHTENADVDVQVDPSLIGGWRLEGRERLIDASFKKQLLDMYNAATSH